MSLAVMAVRLAIKAALAPYVAPGFEPAWPTLVADRVFDSRFDLLDGRGGERTPLIVFAVEAIEGQAFSAQNGARGDERGFDLSTRMVISAQVTSRQRFRDEDGTEFDAEAADLLDQELGDMLAVIQDQVWATLDRDPIFRKVTLRVTKLDAEPYPSSESGEKLAVLANSFYIEPLGDGEKALGIVRDGLPAGSTVRARAELALSRMQATRAVLAAAVLARSGIAATASFSATGTTQGQPALPPAPPGPPPTSNVTTILDPQEPIL
jgi:hypothetical protein